VEADESKTEPAAAAVAVAEVKTDDQNQNDAKIGNVVIRQSISVMSHQEQTRFFDAVDIMLQSKNGPGSSEFFRLAVKCFFEIVYS
jgi:hypothetical protein